MKILLYTFILFLCLACQHSKRGGETYKYKFRYKTISIYTNEYNDKGLLVKRINHIQTINRYGSLIDVSKEIYSYDQRDSLSEIRHYTINKEKQSQELDFTETFTDSMIQRVGFFKYPNDTSSYALYKKNKDGNIIEGYRKDFFVDAPSESRSFTTYENGRISSTIREDFLEKTRTERIYKYEAKGDTFFTRIYQDGKLDFESKRYVDNGVTMEVSRSLDEEWFHVDTLITEERVKRSVSYYSDGKDIDKFLYDEHGNEIEYISESWDRIKLTE